jgi:hypothetical protein
MTAFTHLVLGFSIGLLGWWLLTDEDQPAREQPNRDKFSCSSGHEAGRDLAGEKDRHPEQPGAVRRPAGGRRQRALSVRPR